MSGPDPVAYFDTWQFTTNQTKFACPGMDGAACRPPGNACARDPSTSRQFCCDGPPARGRVCWGLEVKCALDGTTIDCTDGKRKFCCLAGSEKCSETPGQAAGICWSRRHDPLNNVTIDDLTRLHSKLNASKPLATSLPFDLVSIVSATATAPFLTASAPPTASTGSSSSTPPPPSASSSNTSPPPDSPALSGGAIAGIVIGAIAAVALVALAVLGLFWMRRRKSAAAAADAAQDYQASPAGAQWATVAAGSQMGSSPGPEGSFVKPTPSPQPHPYELDKGQATPQELSSDGGRQAHPYELSGDSSRI